MVGILKLSPSLFRIALLIALVFNIVSVAWWCYDFYSFASYPNLTIIVTEPNQLIAAGEFLISAAVVLVDLWLLVVIVVGGKL